MAQYSSIARVYWCEIWTVDAYICYAVPPDGTLEAEAVVGVRQGAVVEAPTPVSVLGSPVLRLRPEGRHQTRFVA